MGYKQSAALIVIVAALLLLTPIGYGQLVDGAIFSGRICCTFDGNCPTNSTGIPGVRVKLDCKSISGIGVRVGSQLGAFTNNIGVFNIREDSLKAYGVGRISGVSQCNVTASLPLNSRVCPTLNNVNGTLIGVPVLLSSILSLEIGRLGNVVVLVFDLIRI